MRPETTGCKARQYSDQMICGPCGLAWDVNDPDPPACRSDVHQDTEISCKSRVALPNFKQAKGAMSASVRQIIDQLKINLEAPTNGK